MSQHIEEIIDARKPMRFHDPELWSFMGRQMGPNLRNLSTATLTQRLLDIEKNIQYLNGSLLIDFDARDDVGWMSFTWWLRARHWTLMEIERRELTPAPCTIIPNALRLDEQVKEITRSENGILARVGQEKYLKPFLHGELRFSPAAVYNDSGLGVARADDEMKKSRSRPGQVLTITLPNGRTSNSIGDVQFSSNRQIEVDGRLVDRPYLFCSFSSEVDPRLIDEFPGSDAMLVVFDVDEFMERSMRHLENVMPGPSKGLVVNDYYDPHYIFQHRLAAIKSKELEYALQREVRFVIDPGADVNLAAKVFTTETRSFADIAGLYDRHGERIDGAGPTHLWAVS